MFFRVRERTGACFVLSTGRTCARIRASSVCSSGLVRGPPTHLIRLPLTQAGPPAPPSLPCSSATILRPFTSTTIVLPLQGHLLPASTSHNQCVSQEVPVQDFQVGLLGFPSQDPDSLPPDPDALPDSGANFSAIAFLTLAPAIFLQSLFSLSSADLLHNIIPSVRSFHTRMTRGSAHHASQQSDCALP